MPTAALKASQAAERYRRLLLAREKIAASRLVETYGAIWHKLKPLVDAVQREIDAMEKPGVAALGRSERLKALKRQVEAELAAWAPLAEKSVVEGIEEAIRLAQEATRDTVASSLGKGRLSEAIMARWDVLPRSAIIELIGMTDPVGALGLGMAEQLGPEVAKGIVKEFATGIALGRSPIKVAAQIRRQFSVPLDWALRNSRTAMLYAYRESSRAQARANDHIVKGWVWSSAKQANTCAACLALDGSFHTLDERLDDHYNGRCLTPGSFVSGPEIMAFIARRYNGKVVCVRTASGKFLSVTPNHPILTDRGWIGAQFLKEGDNVVCYIGEEWTTAAMRPYKYQVPILVEDIPRSLGMYCLGSVPGTPQDFHGDGVDSDVHIIWANRFLRDCLYSSLTQPVDQKQFGWRSLEANLLASLRYLCAMLGRVFLPSRRLLCDGNTAMMFLSRGLTGQKAVSLDSTSLANSRLSETHANCSSGDAIDFGKQGFRFPSLITSGDFLDGQIQLGEAGGGYLLPHQSVSLGPISEKPLSLEEVAQSLLPQVKSGSRDSRTLASEICFDRVSEISITSFCGHVYNLQTQLGWNIANSIITHNCAAVYITKTWEELGFPGLKESTRQRQTGEEWLREQPPEIQDKILGKAGGKAWRAGRVQLGDVVGYREDPAYGRMVSRKAIPI